MPNFTLISAKYARSMQDLTEKEQELFYRYIAEHPEVPDDRKYDFFTADGPTWTTDDVQILYWIYRGELLIDINGWPGDNEDGCLFYQEKIVAWNRDQDLISLQSCPLELIQDMEILQYLRPKGDLDLEKIPEDLREYARGVHKVWSEQLQRECNP
jgi:hypothetical protein